MFLIFGSKIHKLPAGVLLQLSQVMFLIFGSKIHKLQTTVWLLLQLTQLMFLILGSKIQKLQTTSWGPFAFEPANISHFSVQDT